MSEESHKWRDAIAEFKMFLEREHNLLPDYRKIESPIIVLMALEATLMEHGLTLSDSISIDNNSELVSKDNKCEHDYRPYALTENFKSLFISYFSPSQPEKCIHCGAPKP